MLEVPPLTEYTAPQPPQPLHLAAKAYQPSKPLHSLHEQVPDICDHLAKVPLLMLRRDAMRNWQIALRRTPRFDFRMVTALFDWAAQNTVD